MKSISRNYLYNLFYQILILLLPLITTPYLARALGAEAIGIYSYTLSIATYFAIFGALGTSMYGQREIAYVQNDKEKRSLLFWEIVLLRIITMVFSIIIFSATFANHGDYEIYYKILLIELISQAIDISWFFQGLEEFKKTVIRNTIVKIVFVVCIFIFVKSPEDLYKYMILVAGSNLLGNLTLWLYLPKYLQKIKFKTIRIVKHIKSTIGLFIPQIATQIYTVLDRTMIGLYIEDKSEVGFYEQAQKIVKMMLVAVTSLGTVMVPRMAHTFAQGDFEQLKKYMFTSFKFVYLVALPIMAGLLIVSANFVPIFFGEGYDKVILLINVILPILLFIGLSNVIGVQYLLTTKQQKIFTISVTAGAIINFVLNIIFIPKIGALGASITTVIAEFTVTAVQFYYVRNFIKVKDVLKLAKNYVFATVIMFVVVYATGVFVKIEPIPLIIIQVIEGCIIYGGILLLIKDEFCYTIKDKIMEKLHIRRVKEKHD